MRIVVIVKRDAEVRVVRDGVVVYTGRIHSLRRFKEDATEVRAGYECGIGVSNFNDVKVGDTLDNTYSVDGVKSGRLLLTYMPLKIQQSLAVGDE